MKQPLLFITTIFLLTAQACKTNDAPEPSLTNPNLKYFGYTLVDVGWDDPSDAEEKTNYIDEVAAFTNIADILITSPDDIIESRLQLMDQHQVKAILHLNDLLFEQTGTGGDLSGKLYDLRSDYQARWDAFVEKNELIKNSNLLQAFFVGEEPTWNSISFSELKSATDYIKSTIPTIPILIVEAYTAIDILQVPTTVDWVGFNHYFIKDPNTDETFRAELALLKSKHSTSSQKTVLVMDAHYIASVHGSLGISENDMKLVATYYYILANSDLNTVAVIGYFWPSGFDDPLSKGSRNLPQSVTDEHIRIGKAITGK